MITIINILMVILMGYVNYNRDVSFTNGGIIVYIWSPPMIYLETFYMGITMFLCI